MELLPVNYVLVAGHGARHHQRMAEILEGEARAQVLEELVPLAEAALLAYIAAFGIDNTISRAQRNEMAGKLCELLVVYAVSPDRRVVQRLAKHELDGAIFAEGGERARFTDRRESIAGLAVTRTALKAALAALKPLR